MHPFNLFSGLAAAQLLAVAPAFAAGAEPGNVLTLSRAEQLALAADPSVSRLRAQSAALAERAIADGQLPDTELSIGLAEVPLDDFDPGDHEDTEVRLGLSQAFPPGRTLRFRTERMDAMASAEQARAENEMLEVLRRVRSAFVELYYQEAAQRLLDRNRTLFQEMVSVTEQEYSQGRGNQHDVTRAQLELSLMQDRTEETLGAIATARAELSKWIGAADAGRPLPAGEPALPEPPAHQELVANLGRHPLLEADDAAIAAAEKSVSLAEEQYKPQWLIDFMLAENTAGAFDQQSGPDFAGVFLKMSLPVFTDKRQDRQLAASRQEAVAARFGRSDRLRDLARDVETEQHKLERIERRIELYRERAAIEAAETQEAAFSAYQNGLADFETLVRARSLLLETELSLLHLGVERLRSRINLLYFAGGAS